MGACSQHDIPPAAGAHLDSRGTRQGQVQGAATCSGPGVHTPRSGRSASGTTELGKTTDVNKYTFGDDQSALDRLLLVARAYESVSRAFLHSHGTQRVEVALDLGCGPGFSTQLLNDVCRPRSLIGIDSSGTFVEAARDLLPGVRFETHDVGVNPLPGAPADLIYSRLLLAHMADPLGVARAWLNQLHPGGSLLVEDLEEVIDPPGPLREYERVSAEIVRSGGGVMYAGALLADLGGVARRVEVSGSFAAQIYLFNVRRWRETPDLPVADDQLGDLEMGLTEVVDHDHGTSVAWIVRQVAIRD